jgi:glutaconate CoA-transferase, subunit B
MNYSRAELMAIVVSRALRDGDVVVTGTRATLPSAACGVARLCGKPRVRVLIGATGTIDPEIEPVPISGGDQAFLRGRVILDLATGVTDQLRGFADVIFLGGLQLDAQGRCNLAVVGDYARPRLRGPGSIGLSMVASVRRTFMFFAHHDARVFVRTVDFVSGTTLGDGRELLVVTPLGVLGSVPHERGVVLKSVHPGVNLADIQAHTGFALDARYCEETAAPSADELAAMRSLPDGQQLATIGID